jgi:trimethylamine--corrinoid protein Co-methyltransferase
MEVLSAEQVEVIHDRALAILEALGLEVISEEAEAVLKDAGCELSPAEEGTLVRFPRALVEASIATPPTWWAAGGPATAMTRSTSSSWLIN